MTLLFVVGIWIKRFALLLHSSASSRISFEAYRVCTSGRRTYFRYKYELSSVLSASSATFVTIVDGCSEGFSSRCAFCEYDGDF
jgi:hypothetical protein